MLKQAIILVGLLALPAGAAFAFQSLVLNPQNQTRSGIVGSDQGPACAAAGGIGPDTDCRRHGVQIDPMSGHALSADDQCLSLGGNYDNLACFKNGAEIDPYTGAPLQQGDPNYVPQQSSN